MRLIVLLLVGISLPKVYMKYLLLEIDGDETPDDRNGDMKNDFMQMSPPPSRLHSSSPCSVRSFQLPSRKSAQRCPSPLRWPPS